MSDIDRSDRGAGYVVPRPRATDAVGASLRGTFAPCPQLPSDIARLLRHLDRLDS